MQDTNYHNTLIIEYRNTMIIAINYINNNIKILLITLRQNKAFLLYLRIL